MKRISVARRGVGSSQLKKERESGERIVKLLSDGEWHRYREMKEETKLSTATLAKHLKELLRGLVEKKIDIESGKYPYPVYYKMKSRNSRMAKEAQEWKEFVTQHGGKGTVEGLAGAGNLHRQFEWINEMLTLQTLLNLQIYFEEEKNDVEYEQASQFLVVSIYEEACRNIKNELEQMSAKGEDVPKLIKSAFSKVLDDYDLVWGISTRNRKR